MRLKFEFVETMTSVLDIEVPEAIIEAFIKDESINRKAFMNSPSSYANDLAQYISLEYPDLGDELEYVKSDGYIENAVLTK